MDDMIETTNDVHYDAYKKRTFEKGVKLPAVNQEDQYANFVNKLKEEEEAVRKNFTERVKKEEARFKSWEQRLVADRERLNKQLEDDHAAFKKLQEEVNELMKLNQALKT
jgi:cell division control protein 12